MPPFLGRFIPWEDTSVMRSMRRDLSIWIIWDESWIIASVVQYRNWLQCNAMKRSNMSKPCDHPQWQTHPVRSTSVMRSMRRDQSKRIHILRYEEILSWLRCRRYCLSEKSTRHNLTMTIHPEAPDFACLSCLARNQVIIFQPSLQEKLWKLGCVASIKRFRVRVECTLGPWWIRL